MYQLTVERVAALQGNALMVLTILALERGPRSQDWLMATTGMSDKTLGMAVRKLQIFGYIVEAGRYVWRLADGVEQLPLGAVGEGDVPQASHRPYEESGVVDAVVGEIGRNISELGDHACMQDSDSLYLQDDEPTYMDDGQVGISDLDAARTGAEAVRAAGIQDPALSRLLARKGLTARVVRYHVKHAPSLGAAITRIEQNWVVPKDWERDRQRYSDDKYAAFIHH